MLVARCNRIRPGVGARVREAVRACTLVNACHLEGAFEYRSADVNVRFLPVSAKLNRKCGIT